MGRDRRKWGGREGFVVLGFLELMGIGLDNKWSRFGQNQSHGNKN